IRSIGFQIATVAGPAVGGVLFAVHEELVYVVAGVLFALALVGVLALRERVVERAPAGEKPPTLQSLLGGIRLIRGTSVPLGAIPLGLFAVLFGGAVALLPLFARSILHTGPAGLGILRSAPAVGALVAGLVITRRPIGERAGRTLLLVVAAFGLSM